MEPIYKKESPLPGVTLIEIFKPYQTNNTIVYPVSVDGLKTTIESTGIHKWTAKGFGQAVKQEVIDYIGSEIERHEL